MTIDEKTMGTPPKEVVEAAELVGQWFAERRIKAWALGPCASRAHGERELARAVSDREVAWQNIRVLEKARQEEMAKRDKLQVELNNVVFEPRKSNPFLFMTGRVRIDPLTNEVSILAPDKKDAAE